MEALIVKLNGKAHATIAPEYSPGTAGLVILCHLNPKFIKKKGQLFKVEVSGMQETESEKMICLGWPQVTLNQGDLLSVQRARVKKITVPTRRNWDSDTAAKPIKSTKRETQIEKTSDALEIVVNGKRHATVAPQHRGMVYVMVTYDLNWSGKRKGAFFTMKIRGRQHPNDKFEEMLSWPGLRLKLDDEICIKRVPLTKISPPKVTSAPVVT